MNQVLRKTITTLLAGSALAIASTQASAVMLSGGLTFDGSNGSSAVIGATAVKNWADMAIDLGWMHTTKWYTLHVSAPGDVHIQLTDTSTASSATTAYTTGANAGKTVYREFSGNSVNPAFSVWSFGGAAPADPGSLMTSAGNPSLPTSPLATHYNGTGTQTNNTMGYNQVAGPDAANPNNSNFLADGGISGFVGYSNSGASFVNGNGNAVGSGSVGSSSGTIAGHKYAALDLFGLAAGDYLLAVGANCVYLTGCGKEATLERWTNTADGSPISETLNPANTWGAGSLKLTVQAVPVPAAVWLFGSALAGMGVFGRRRQSV